MPLRWAQPPWRRVAEILLDQEIFGAGLFDAEGRIAAVNDVVAHATGYTREELIGRHISDLVHADDRVRTMREVQRLIDGDLASYTASVHGRARDGGAIWGKIVIWPLRDPQGRTIAGLGIVEDVTDARIAEERARRLDERIRQGMLAMTDARHPKQVLQGVVDLARDVAGARYAALGILPEGSAELSDFLVSGIDAEEIAAIGRWPTGKGLLGAVTRADAPLRLPDLSLHPDSGGFPPHHPPMRSFLGVPIAYKSRILGNLYLADKVGATEFTAEDADALLAFAAQAAVVIENSRSHDAERRLNEELDRTNKELERASETKSVFLASMSHELRTPLHALLLAADILRDPAFPVSEARARELSDTIATSGRHLLGLIDDLLELSRLEAGRFGVRLEPTSLALVLTECRQAIAPLASRNRVVLEVPEAAGGIWVEADPLRLRQAIINLLANAVKFTDQQGRVWIEVRPSNGFVAIAVCDTGKGIAPEDLERVFMPFEQVGAPPGVGLGLAISKSIARAHGGTLQVWSELGKGTRFELTVRRSDRVVRSAPTGTEPHHGPAAGGSLLVVEDDARGLELTLDILRSAGYTATGVATVTEALDAIDASRPDLVLLDVKLGAEDGLDVVRRLRGDPTARDIPVVAASASISDAEIERAREAGCVSFLGKPLTPQTLLAEIRNRLEPSTGV